MNPVRFGVWYLSAGMYAMGRLDADHRASFEDTDDLSGDFADHVALRFGWQPLEHGEDAIRAEWAWYAEALQELQADRPPSGGCWKEQL